MLALRFHRTPEALPDAHGSAKAGANLAPPDLVTDQQLRMLCLQMLLKDLHLPRTERLLPQVLLDEVLGDDAIDIISEDHLVDLLRDLFLVFLQVPNKP